MSILYGIMFLVMRNLIIVGKDGVHFAKRQRRVRPIIVTTDYEEEKASQDLARVLLFYPAVYIICVLPSSISRWLSFSGHHVPFQFTLFSSALFAYSGFFNVILYFTTRRDYTLGSTRPIISAQLPSTHHLLLPSSCSSDSQAISPASTATLAPSPSRDNNYDEIGLLNGRRHQRPSYQKWYNNSNTNNTYERIGQWHNRNSSTVFPSPTDTGGTGTTLCMPSPVES
ncbi:hypothetical protein EST38_g11777 [Candolleomyces aberdarensis]|uniref:G protein-coupled receptor GPR1 C-terminal domain-containing protein n=1 Tax=Candolleomyces aberdarensis TaxID=2316362 RepID=A0A4Q2D416_9AGAR|nr:hypothetical protein EST38_g11777 [Candolleomyces aberdarensis]